jgi:hypothetical protein
MNEYPWWAYAIGWPVLILAVAGLLGFWPGAVLIAVVGIAGPVIGLTLGAVYGVKYLFGWRPK